MSCNQNREAESRVIYWVLLGGCLAALGFRGLIHVFHLEQIFDAPCPFWKLTGLYCPGCGGTRAIRALLHGDILLSLRCHPLILYLACFLTVFLGSNTLSLFSGGRIWGMQWKNRWLWIAVVVTAVSWIVKNWMLLQYGIELPERV